MNTHLFAWISCARHATLLFLLAALLPAGQDALAQEGPATTAEGWVGPRPGTVLPDAALVQSSRNACVQAKQGQHVLPQEQGLREEDPLTWYDVFSYDLAVAVFQGADALDGFCIMYLSSLRDGLDVVVLHAAPNIQVASVTWNGQQDLSFTREGDLLAVQLEQPLAEGQQASLLIQYQAQFNGCGVLSSWRTNVQTGQSVHTFTTQAEPFDARCWWPCKDDTRDKADSVRVRIVTNDFATAVSNGTLESNEDNGDGTRTFTWFERWPMVTYLVSLCVTEYNHAQTTWNWNDTSMPMHDWSWGLSSSDQQNVLLAGTMALSALSDRFGLYPFHDEKYGHAQYTWGGAMEHQTCSSMGFYSEAVIAHELAHQWFGDKITCDTFHHIWLNEGWATYSEALYFEQELGSEALHEYMSYEAYLGGGTIYVEDPLTQNIFDGNLSYAKGAWVLHMLRHVMGEDAFWEGVHAYLGPNEAPFHRTADTEEFRSFMEDAYGADLEWFFQEWIMGEYWPDYAYHWSSSLSGEQHQLHLAIIQRQVPGRQLFTMPVDVLIHYADGSSETRSVWCESEALSVVLEIPQEAVEVELDPQDWILGPVTELQTPPATDLRITSAQLRNADGQPMERLPGGGNFQFALTLSNLGLPSGPLQLSLTSTHPDLSIDGPGQTESIDFAQSRDLLFTGNTIDGIAGYAGFTLLITWAGGSLEESWSFPSGDPEVLLVDDDGGATYESWYEEAMAGQLDYQTVTPDEIPAELGAYGLVIWMTGDSRRALSAEEWAATNMYVNSGGHLVFTGQNFAEAQDPVELNGHCGIEVLNPAYDNNAVDGADGGIFDGRICYLFNGGAGNQSEMDVISGVVDCMQPQVYYHNMAQGSAAEELLCGEGGLITFGFGLEGIADIGNGMELDETLATLLAWSRGETAVEPPPAARPASRFTLVGAQPNPFNPSTRILWQAPTGGLLSGEVVNVAGQRVEDFAPRQVSAGSGSLVWQARGLASGLYLARLRLEGPDGIRQEATVKVMLLQ